MNVYFVVSCLAIALKRLLMNHDTCNKVHKKNTCNHGNFMAKINKPAGNNEQRRRPVSPNNRKRIYTHHLIHLLFEGTRWAKFHTKVTFTFGQELNFLQSNTVFNRILSSLIINLALE